MRTMSRRSFGTLEISGTTKASIYIALPPPTGVNGIPTTSLRLDPVARCPKVLTASHSLRTISRPHVLATRDVTNEV